MHRQGKRVWLVNVSKRYKYNLGLEKAAAFFRARGWEVVQTSSIASLLLNEGDLVLFSALFTWDLPHLVRQARTASERGAEVEVGGPAVTLMSEWVRRHLPYVKVWKGLREEWDQQPGGYRATFTTRGCIRRCNFCAVPKLEPEFHIIEKFIPAPVILDNNILAAGKTHLRRVIEKLRSFREIDFNQGLDARLFNKETFDLLRELPIKVWRFAFDTLAEEAYVARAVEILKKAGVSYRDIRVYVLYGFKDTPEEAHYRAQKVIEWGASPWPMPYVPLNWLSQERYIPPGWTYREHVDFQRYYRRGYLWRSVSWEEYRGTGFVKVPMSQLSLFAS